LRPVSLASTPEDLPGRTKIEGLEIVNPFA